MLEHLQEVKTLSIYLIAIVFLIVIPLGIWAYRARSSKEIEKKYPLRVRWYYLPFYDGWKKLVNVEDREIFEEYIFRFNVVWVVLFLAHILVHFFKGYAIFGLLGALYYGP